MLLSLIFIYLFIYFDLYMDVGIKLNWRGKSFRKNTMMIDDEGRNVLH